MVHLLFLFCVIYIGAALFSISAPKPATAIEGPFSLVFASNEDSVLRFCWTSEHPSTLVHSSFKGFKISGCNSSRNSLQYGDLRPGVPLEMSMRESQQQTSYSLSDVRVALDNRYSAFQSAENADTGTESASEMGPKQSQYPQQTPILGLLRQPMGARSMDQVSSRKITSTAFQCRLDPKASTRVPNLRFRISPFRILPRL